MDEDAKAFLRSHRGKFEPTKQARPLPVMQSWLEIQGSTVHNNFAHHIKLNYFGPKLESRLISKINIPAELLSTINWLALERSYKKIAAAGKVCHISIDTQEMVHSHGHCSMGL